MAIFNLDAKQLATIQSFIESGRPAKVESFNTPTACTTCWGGSCANGITG
ncbi:MAG: hypothetical protein MJZ89_06560 [Paludibacteraceae bacterium]|nr:hypothetical protein [Paludibacteraceae bacterium]